MISGGIKSYSSAISTKTEVKSVDCQNTLTWVFSDRPLRTVQSSLRASGEPGSVSAGTQASSGSRVPVSADVRVPCESATGSEIASGKGSADPSKTAQLLLNYCFVAFQKSTPQNSHLFCTVMEKN